MTKKQILAVCAGTALVCTAFGYQQYKITLLQQELMNQASHISSLEARLNVKMSERIDLSVPEHLNPGIYRIEVELNPDTQDAATAKYSVTHFVLEVNTSSRSYPLQFGWANSGWLNHVIYFDYDNDGLVDTKMAGDYAKSVPMVGSLLANTLDPNVAQSIYNQFRINAHRAEFWLAEDIAEQADKEAAAIWGWLDEQKEDFAEWIENAISERD